MVGLKFTVLGLCKKNKNKKNKNKNLTVWSWGVFINDKDIIKASIPFWLVHKISARELCWVEIQCCCASLSLIICFLSLQDSVPWFP